MEFQDIWNDICFRIEHKSSSISEHDFQIIAESFFEKLGWLQYKGEIITQEIIQVGASKSVKPDIIIKKDGQALFVVELKKPNIIMSKQNVEQLISYMRWLKLNFGILLGETLQVYYELPTDNRPPVRIIDISFGKDSNKGIELIKLLSKNEYSFEKFQKYCEDILVDIEKKENAQKYINLLCSEKGVEIIINLLKKEISGEYSDEIIAFIISKINIQISRKGNNNPPVPCSSPDPHPPQPSSKGLSRSGAKRLCRANGLDLNGKITFASRNTGNDTYWANPNIEFINYNWWLLLNNYNERKLYIFYIPANSIEENQVKVRADTLGEDTPTKIDLQIKYRDDFFADSRSGIQFYQWLIRTISY
jgi:hypothetical protein